MTTEKTIRSATYAEVREWARNRGLAGSRGPLSKTAVDAFNKAHRATKYGAEG